MTAFTEQERAVLTAVMGGSWLPTNVGERVTKLLKEACRWMKDYPEQTKEGIPTEVWKSLAEFGSATLETDLINRLHAAERHPDFEYTEKESDAQGYASTEPNEGQGWILNTFKAAHGQYREDYRTITFWYRPLSAKAEEDINIFDTTPAIAPPKPVNLIEYLLWLAEQVPEGTMSAAPAPTPDPALGYDPHERERQFNEALKKLQRPQFVSKPNYVTRGTFIEAVEPGLNVYSPEFDTMAPDGDVITREARGTVKAIDRKVEYWHTPLPDVEILTNLKNPFEETFVRCKRGNGKWGIYHQWPSYPPLHVDRHILKAKIENPWS